MKCETLSVSKRWKGCFKRKFLKKGSRKLYRVGKKTNTCIMKKLLFAIIVHLTISSLNAQDVINLNVMGNSYTVSKAFPPEIIGTYTYEGNGGNPKVFLKDDGTGYFQPHGVAPVDILFWIDCDETGKWRKQVGGTGRYQYTLVIQYQDGGTTKNYEYGKYDLLGVMIQPDMGRVSILGERYKPLK